MFKLIRIKIIWIFVIITIFIKKTCTFRFSQTLFWRSYWNNIFITYCVKITYLFSCCKTIHTALIFASTFTITFFRSHKIIFSLLSRIYCFNSYDCCSIYTYFWICQTKFTFKLNSFNCSFCYNIFMITTLTFNSFSFFLLSTFT